MVPLTTAANPLAARILAAHLGAEGIVWQLRGNVDGPYPVGPVEVLVPADDLEVARAVVASSDADAVTVTDDEPGFEPRLDAADGVDAEAATEPHGRPVRTLILVIGLVLVVLFVLGRVLLLGN
jgi:Putative prokaryotic signal transducing protein